MIEIPTISIVTCCYNPDLKIFKKSLESVSNQIYPKKHIEHIVMDGGSTNGADALAREFGCAVVSMPELLHAALTRMSLGIKKSRNDIILLLEPDNILQGKNWLRQMVQPFIDDPSITGTFSIYNGYEKNMPILTKYYALLGANDPTLYYLKKSEKLSRIDAEYTLGKIIAKKNNYYKVRFDRTNLPTLGDNGHMVRRNLINKVIKDPSKFLHTDAFFKLLKLGHTDYGVVNNSIIHYAGGSILQNLYKRVSYKNKFYRSKNYPRVYYVFSYKSKSDILNLLKFIFFSITFIQPIYMSFKGYVKTGERAWFIHPIMCIGCIFFYAVSELSTLFSTRYEKN